MTYALILPSAFIASREFPAVCAMTGTNERLQRVSVPVYRHKYQQAGGDMPREVSLYLSTHGRRAVGTARLMQIWIMGAAVAGAVLMILMVNLLPKSGPLLAGTMILMISAAVTPAILLQVQWKKIPVVFASAQNGCVEVQFPPTGREAYHACQAALTGWQEERNRREEFKRREERLQRGAGEWGAGKHAAGASDRFADEVEPGWDEADAKSQERVKQEKRVQRRGEPGTDATNDW